MSRLTPRGERVAAWSAPLVIIGVMWTATLLGNAATGSTETSDRQGGSQSIPREGTLPVGGLTSAPAVAPTVRPVPTRAARSRPTATPITHRRTTKATSGLYLSVTCYVWTGNRTASGVWPAPGQAASNLFPFGTKLRVEGVGIVTVTDRVGHSSDLDLFYSSRSECLRFGRQQLRVELIR